MLARLSLQFRTTLPFSKEYVAAWHSRPGANERLNPSWNRVKDIVVETRIDAVDKQHCALEDRVQYRHPSVWLPTAWAEGRLRRLFAYRHRVMLHDLTSVMNYPQTPLKLLVTGPTGLVGAELCSFLRAAGHRVLELSRVKDQSPDTIWWDPITGQVDLSRLENLDGVFHLAGENIAGFWTDAKKRRIRESRIVGTLRLVEALSSLKTPPKALICASAVGYYGENGSAQVDERYEAGHDFLADVCKDWEAAAQHYTAGRVACLRFGVILSPAGGALSKMLIPFRFGLGGRMGSGQQYMSWIGIDDALYQCYHVLRSDIIQGPVNVVAPYPVTNAEFTATLGDILHRPAFFHMPACAVKTIFGEMGRTTMLTSIRALPSVLEATQATFAYPTLDQTLDHLLK